MLDVNYFDELRIGLATGDQIRAWSNGEVKKPETINYRTLKPEKDGLFCEKIFGPTKDWECYCGKYKRVRFKGIICERCGVEVTRAKVRRERMGHIELAAPVTHIWYFKGVPSRLGYLLDIAPKELEKVIYFAASIITSVDEAKRHKDLPNLEEQIQTEVRTLEERRDSRIDDILKETESRLEEMEGRKARSSEKKAAMNQSERQQKDVREKAERDIFLLQDTFDLFRDLNPKQIIEDEQIWRELKDRFGDYFRGGMGAESIKDLLAQLDLVGEADFLREQIRTAKGQKRQRAIKRLKVVAPFTDESKRNSPMGMVLDAVPVIPPDLRPMVQLDGGRFATSDLNDLYRRVINRNNRLKRLLDLGAPEIIVNNEKRMLQEAVDALFDNGRRGRPVTGPGNRPLKSLSDMLKGKQGRFRQNLLGKRVDYSGRSVIVAGPTLKLHQCGLPKQMALELFKPFVMKRLVDLGHAQNIKSAKRMVERSRSVVWDVLEEIIHEHPVLLNRAPTLHRLGIQAFEPVLVEGKAIQIHPLVCVAFNADFDGDQMAVHVPLSAEAQAEARILMLSAHNVLSPAHGDPIVTPTQDMVIGCYYLTVAHKGEPGEGRVFSSTDELLKAYDAKVVGIHATVKVRGLKRFEDEAVDAFSENPGRLMETTCGRVIFNAAFPEDFPFQNSVVKKKELAQLIDRCARIYTKGDLAHTLDSIKDTGFRYATKAGVTIGLEDVTTPEKKPQILAEHEKRAEKVESQYRKGVITEDERRQELIEIWTEATERVKVEMERGFDELNPIYMMANSGARGNIQQIRQIAGMRGLVANPRGEIIPRPIRANFREGLTVLEYFISTHGARKGLADTALRTADSGYLTRRLVDVAQEVLVRIEDCGTDRGIRLDIQKEGPFLKQKLHSRVLLEDAASPDGEVIVPADEAVTAEMSNRIEQAGVKEVIVRSVLTCEARYGVCQRCYGVALATGLNVELGEAVGIVAAQSIGEPGTQLTMRTFHTGGVAGEDITHGLPRVVELFEARTPKGKAEIARATGRVEIKEDERTRTIDLIPDDGSETIAYKVSRRARLRVRDDETVEAGESLTEGSKDPDEILEILGTRDVQLYLVNEVQSVYRSQGVPIHDKHIELIVRQMLRKVTVIEPGETDFLPGELVDARMFAEANETVVSNGGQAATARPILMGITKASLATESWLSAASFQETTRVLTEAAIRGKSDPLLGLKENVIIGKLIPAGTGMSRYRSIQVNTTGEAAMSDAEARELLGLPPREAVEDEEARELLGVSAAAGGLTAVPVSGDGGGPYGPSSTGEDGLSAVPSAEDVATEATEETGGRGDRWAEAMAHVDQTEAPSQVASEESAVIEGTDLDSTPTSEVDIDEPTAVEEVLEAAEPDAEVGAEEAIEEQIAEVPVAEEPTAEVPGVQGPSDQVLGTAGEGPTATDQVRGLEEAVDAEVPEVGEDSPVAEVTEEVPVSESTEEVPQTEAAESISEAEAAEQETTLAEPEPADVEQGEEPE
jgi:DNA-directed RNA polymerase subunit beta'